MRKHSDIALLRKMVQQKFKGVSEAPPMDGFEDIQNLLTKRNTGLTQGKKLFLGLTVVAILAISSAIYFKDLPESSPLVNQQNPKKDNTSVTQKTDSTTITSHSSPSRKLERSPRETSPQIKSAVTQNILNDIDDLPLKSQKEKERLFDVEEPLGQVETFSPANLNQGSDSKKDALIPVISDLDTQEEAKMNALPPTVTSLPNFLRTIDGFDQNISAENGKSQVSVFEANSSFRQSPVPSGPTSALREALNPKELKADENLLKSLFKSGKTPQIELQGPALDLKYGKRVKYFYELQTFSAHFKLTDIDTENFISYNQDLGWSTDNLGLRFGLGINYLFMKGLSFKLGVRYTHFSKKINYDVAKRVRDASIPINDQQVPVYHIIENRTDRIRHFGLGIHTGIQMKLGDRYLGVEVDYSKSLVDSTLGSTNLLLSGYLKLGSFWFRNGVVIVELHASRALSSWKNELLQYELQQFGLTLKYPILSRK